MNPNLQRAWAAFEGQRYAEAHAQCMAVLKATPMAAEPYALLGAIALRHNTFDKAADLFARASQLAPTVGGYGASLAQSLLGLNRTDQARAAAVRALGLAAGDAAALDTLGVVFSRLGDQDRAADCFRKAVALAPKNSGYQFNLGWAEQFLGDFAAAEAAYRRAIALEPGMERAYSALVRLAPQTREGNFIRPLERLFNATKDPLRRLAIGHALAKTYEDLKEDAQSLTWLGRAKAGLKDRAQAAARRREPLFEAARRTFPTTAPAKPGHPSPAPIFVFGLPRTGTTLVERILSSHPQVTSVGETMAFALAARRLSGVASPELIDPMILNRAATADPAVLGAEFLRAAGQGVRTPRFSEKSPLNFLFAGLIHRALPNARLICLRRDPMDSCLANYRQSFATDFAYYDHVYDMAEMARYFVSFDALIAHWRQVLPTDRFTEVSYEAVVADQEAETRRLLAFCGLDWDPACLNFHENAAPVATASAVQVRQPVYATSIARWKRYGDGLEPMAAVLRDAGLLAE